MFPKYPAVIGAVASQSTLQALPKLTAQIDCCDLLEFRLDALADAGHGDIAAALRDAPRPTLITVRDPLEGGAGALDQGQRHALFENHMDTAAILDIEIRNLKDSKAVVEIAKNGGRVVLGSFHDFAGTPSQTALEETIQKGIDSGADGIKIAVTTDTTGQVKTLLSLLEKYQAIIPMAVMGMGTLGMSSRILFAQCGSILNYTYLVEANAPGQWSSQMMRTLFDEIGIGSGGESTSVADAV